MDVLHQNSWQGLSASAKTSSDEARSTSLHCRRPDNNLCIRYCTRSSGRALWISCAILYSHTPTKGATSFIWLTWAERYNINAQAKSVRLKLLARKVFPRMFHGFECLSSFYLSGRTRTHCGYRWVVSETSFGNYLASCLSHYGSWFAHKRELGKYEYHSRGLWSTLSCGSLGSLQFVLSKDWGFCDAPRWLCKHNIVPSESGCLPYLDIYLWREPWKK